MPSDIVELCEEQLTILERDTRDPRLHVKKLRPPYDDALSFRITRNYRALFYFSANDRIVVFDIDHRKDAYR